MNNFRRLFYQIILVVLALAFTLCIRYIVSTKSTEAGTFGAENEDAAVTVSAIFSSMTEKGR
ncbi:MAG: hypothetical protein IKI97_13485 [Clostridia bacterium]|nr:hypothetical protein [Clostridia bacterium]